MKLNELYEESEKDCKIDQNKLDDESTRLPYVISKWIRYLSEESLKYKIIEAKYHKTRKERFEYYYTDYDIKLSTKDIYEIYLPGDERVQEVKEKLEVAKEKMTFIESIVKALTQKSFGVKNAIDFKKFINGIT